MGETQNLSNFKLLNHIKKDVFVTPEEKLVLLILALHRNDKTLQCNPGIALLAKESRKSERSVFRILRQLIDKKILYPAKDYDHSRHYFFAFDFKEALSMSQNPASSMNGTRSLITKANNFRYLQTACVTSDSIIDKKKNSCTVTHDSGRLQLVDFTQKPKSKNSRGKLH